MSTVSWFYSSVCRGNGASVARIVPYAALHYATYERFRAAIAPQALRIARASSHGRPPVWVDLLAGSCSGATAVAVTYPLDLVRTRMAYNMESSSGATILSTMRSIVARQGVRGLYRVRACCLVCVFVLPVPCASCRAQCRAHNTTFAVGVAGSVTCAAAHNSEALLRCSAIQTVCLEWK